MSNKSSTSAQYNVWLLPFQLFGIAPIGATHRSKIFACVPSVCHLLILAGIAGIASTCSCFERTNPLQSIVLSLIFAAEISTDAVIVLQSLATRRTQAQIPVSFVLRVNPHTWWKHSIFGLILFGTTATHFSYMWWRAVSLADVSNSMLIILPTVANRMRCLQIVCYTDTLRSRLLSITEAVGQLAGQSRVKPGGLAMETRLLQLKTDYGECWRTSDRLNVCFGWSLLFMVTLGILHLTAHGYWVFLTLSGQLFPEQFVDSAMDISGTFFGLIVMCESCDRCRVEVSAWQAY